jgi:hypothetical protein
MSLLRVALGIALAGALLGSGRAAPRRPQQHPAAGSAAGICASGALEVYASDAAKGWAKTRCAPAPKNVPSDAKGFARNWRDVAVKKEDGLTYLTFAIPGEEVGGQIRFNDAPTYRAMMVGNSGGSGTAWPDAKRDGGPNDDTDWQNLQDKHGLRYVTVSWHAGRPGDGPRGAGPAGRFTRNSPAGSTLLDMARRPNIIFEWIYDNLNPEGKPFGLIGSSGGADAVLAPQILQSRIKDKVSYLAPVSYPNPFFDLLATCTGQTPPGTFVTKGTGALGASGVGVKTGSGKALMDGIVLGPDGKSHCADGTMTKALAAGSSTREALHAILARGGSGYAGTLHVLVGTATTDVRNSDLDNGVVWSAGNLFHHPFFAKARRVWYESTTEGHGQAFWDVSGPGFDRVHAEIVRTLLTPPK